MAKLPPIPHSAKPLDGNGYFVPVWSDWLKQVFARAGGHGARSNTELSDDITSLNPSLVPTGSVLNYAGAVAPTGFLLCNGAAVLRADYEALFLVIGETYGAGDGVLTFNLPGEGRFVVNKAAAGAFENLGATGGAESVTLPNHLHSVSLTTGAPSATALIGGGVAGASSSTHTHSVSGNTGNPTSNPDVSTLPPFVVMNMIIKI